MSRRQNPMDMLHCHQLKFGHDGLVVPQAMIHTGRACFRSLIKQELMLAHLVVHLALQ